MRTIAISNYKGGMGKAATAMNLAAIYARRGQRTEAIGTERSLTGTSPPRSAT